MSAKFSFLLSIRGSSAGILQVYGQLRLVLAFFVFLSSSSYLLAAQPDCEEILTLDQVGREFISPSVGYQELKQNLIDALLKQSVEQVLGKQITANSRMELQVRNQQLEESLRTLNVERAKGFVAGYKVLPPGEKIIDMGGTSVMEISISTDVCIPKYRGASYIVAIAEVLDSNGEPVPAGIVESLVAEITANARFTAVRLPVPPDTYYDYTLTGRVKTEQALEVNNTTGKLTAKMFEKLTKKKQRVDEKVERITVELALQLEDVGDRTVSNYIGEGSHTISRRANSAEKMAASEIAMDNAVVVAVRRLMKEF